MNERISYANLGEPSCEKLKFGKPQKDVVSVPYFPFMIALKHLLNTKRAIHFDALNINTPDHRPKFKYSF